MSEKNTPAPAGLTGPVSEYVDPYKLLRNGGEWLGAARNWLKWNAHNGSRVTWGSEDVLHPAFTVRQVEELAANVAAAALNARRPPARDMAPAGMTGERRALVQGQILGRLYSRDAKIPAGTISWDEHERAWQAYARHGHGDQSAERIHERGGFGYHELCDLLGRPPETWRPR